MGGISSSGKGGEACMSVRPGPCGFTCLIRVEKRGRREVSIAIEDSGCGQIQRLAERVTALTLRELFMPLTRNPVYVSAASCGCHSSCVIPAAVIKTVEVCMGMAVPSDVEMRFGCNGGNG